MVMRLILALCALVLAGCMSQPTIDGMGTMTRVEVRTLTGSVITTTIHLDRPGAVAVGADGSITAIVGGSEATPADARPVQRGVGL